MIYWYGWPFWIVYLSANINVKFSKILRDQTKPQTFDVFAYTRVTNLKYKNSEFFKRLPFGLKIMLSPCTDVYDVRF